MRPAHRFFLALVLLVTAAWAGLSLWTDFPYFYHTDEPAKARQVIDGSRNFHHPLLMLDSAAAAARLLGTPREPQAITELGRHLSAAFCAIAAGLLAWTVSRRHGHAAGLLAGTLLVLQPDIQEYGRYFKEDPALLFGWACVFAAMVWFEECPSPGRAALLGAAAALAASGKYVGIVMLAPAIFVLATATRRTAADGESPGAPPDRAPSAETPRPPRRPVARTVLAASFLLSFLVLLAVVNHRILLDTGTFRASLNRETTLVLEGQGTVSKSIPHSGFLERFLNRSLHLLPFIAAGIWTTWKFRRRDGWTPALLALSPVALAVLLSFSAKDSGRYFMPAALGLCAAAAIGMTTLAGLFATPARRRAAFAIMLALACTASFARSWSYISGFRADARKEMLAWMNKNIPANSRILQGRKVSLPDSSGQNADAWHARVRPDITLVSAKLTADTAASAAALAANGFTHIALASDEYAVYLKDHKSKKGREEERQRRREFYESVFKDSALVWHRDGGKVGTHQPELRLYQLPPGR